jgi:anti-anti-sigma factor
MVVFKLSEKNIWPGCREIEIEGELDLAVRERLREALGRAVAERHHVLVDMSRCDFLDAGAMAVLIQAHRQLSDHGRRLLLYGAQGQVRRLFAITGIAETGLLVTAAAPSAPPILWGDRLVGGEKTPESAYA